MTPSFAGLLEVEPVTVDAQRVIRDRYCDLCQQTAYEDIWAGKDMRTFYFDPEQQLNVCEHCVEAYLQEKP